MKLGRGGSCTIDLWTSTSTSTIPLLLSALPTASSPVPRRQCGGTYTATSRASRSFSCSTLRCSTQRDRVSQVDVAAQIRALMRQSAQPVSIITTFLPPEGSSESTSSGSRSGNISQGQTDGSADTLLVHGATLSSLTTISLQPPRVAFSLKLPSRMAEALLHHQQQQRQQQSEQSHPSPPSPHFIINLLSSSQAGIAAALAKPGTLPLNLHTHPSLVQQNSSRSAGRDGHHSASSPESPEEEIPTHPLHEEALFVSSHASATGSSSRSSVTESQGVPILRDSLGALACTLEASVDLGAEDITVESPSQRRNAGDITSNGRPSNLEPEAESGSMLFIARVHAVEGVEGQQDIQTEGAEVGLGNNGTAEGVTKRPLLYWRLDFTTVQEETK